MPWGDGGLSDHVGGKDSGFGSGGLVNGGPAPQAKSKKRGILGTIGHAVDATAHGFEQKAVGIGPGLYDLGKTAYQQTESRITGDKAAQAKADAKAVGVVKGTGKQFVNDFAHPHGDFSGAILDTLTLASLGAGTGARVAAAGRAAKAGETATEVGKALVKGPKPEPRTIKVPKTDQTINAGTYSRSASTRAAQKGLDRLREKYPDVHFGLRNQHQRIGKERARNAAYDERVANFNNKALLAKASRLGKAQQFAIQVVNEKVPLETRIADARKFLADAPNARVRKMLANHLKILAQTKRYVETVDGVPRIKPDHAYLSDVYEHAKAVANKRSSDLVEGGMLNPATAENALSRVARHFDPDHAPELAKKSDFFISYRNAKNPKRLGEVPQIGNTKSVGIPNQLSEISHQFTGSSIRTGNVNPKAVEQVATDSQRANKVLAVWRQRDELRRISSDKKLTENHIPIRPIWLKNKKWPAEVKDAIDGLQQNLTPEQELSIAQRLHDYVFPEKDVSVGASAKGVKWIDRRHLGGLGTPKTLGAAERIGRVADKVNTPFRALTLFKPGYIPANLGNNIFLNVIHGSAHVLPRAAKISRELGVEDAAKLDAIMGEGRTASVGAAAGLGRNLNNAANKLQGTLGRVVDVVPRRAAFLHEANRFGYKTTADVKRLLNDEALHDDLVRVAREANSEMIDYANLGPAEQAFVRRAIFLYPWVKGATMKGGRFLKEQPVKAGVAGQVGDVGAQYTKDTFGDVPSYGRGWIKVGGFVVNTEPLNNFHQATAELEAVVALMEKHPTRSAQILAQSSPAIQALFAPSAGTTSFDSLAGASLVRLGEEAVSPNGSPKKVYKQSRRDAMLRFLVGSVAPREVNLAAAHAQAARDRAGR